MAPAAARKQNKPIVCDAASLRKRFRPGDHVKVLAGSHAGETGSVRRVDGNNVHVISDMLNKEIVVFAKDLQVSVEVMGGFTAFGRFQMYDLVQIDPLTVGCVIKIDRHTLKLLDQNGQIRTVTHQQVHLRRTGDAAAVDSQQNEITCGAVVRVVDGPFAGRQGTVKHVYRTLLFIYTKEVLENSGILVVRTSNTILVGATGAPAGAAPYASPMPIADVRELPVVRHNRTAGGVLAAANDPLLGQTVVVGVGPYKGVKGMVERVSGDNIVVRLQTKLRDVMLRRAQVFPEDATLAPAAALDTGTYAGYPPSVYGNATPGYMTPSGRFGSETPMYDVGRRTPSAVEAWDPAITNTPARPTTPAHDWASGSGEGGRQLSARLAAVGASEPLTSASPAAGTSGGHAGAGRFDAGTPSGGGGGAYRADTPVAATPLPAQAPSTSLHVGAEVRVHGRSGTIESLGDAMASVRFSDGQLAAAVPLRDCARPLLLERGDRVRVTAGAHAGATGVVRMLDGTDCLVCWDHSNETALLTTDQLVKVP